ncbi:MAG: polyprenol monophosphomannose synthase [Candidatus Zixiibacteriota bacterium]
MKEKRRNIENILIIMPMYNEIENIRKIVPVVLEKDDRINILIIDDNSPDGTGEVADELSEADSRISVIHREGKLGLGTAYVVGFKYALEHDYDLAFEMDSDFSHNPDDVPKMISKIEDGYDMVVGSRWVKGGGTENWPRKRELLSKYASVYSRIVTGLPVHDTTAGFQCFRYEVLDSIDLDGLKSGGYSFQIETKFKVWRKGFKIGEIPIVFKDRIEGQSKMSNKIIFEAIGMVWKLKVQAIFGKI